MDQVMTQEAVDTSKVPAVALAEFGKREFDAQTKANLADLEAQVNAQLMGQSQPAPVAPAAPSVYEPVGQPVQANQPAPVAPAAQPQAPVPEKFARPDGSLDQDRLQKSFVSLEQYLEKERELTRVRQQPNGQQFQPQYAPPPQGYIAQPQYAPVPIEQRINEDMRQDPGATVLNIARAAVLQAQQQAEASTLELRRRLELMEMGQKDPAVFTADGHKQIMQTLQDNPWLWNSPTPYLSAYKMAGPIHRQVPPTPVMQQTARPSAPILPGGQPAAGMPQGPQSFSSEGDLRRALEAKFPKDPSKQMQALEEIIARSPRSGW